MKGRKGSAVKAQTVISSIVICAAVCLAGVGYLWGKTEVWQLGRDMKKLEARRDELKRGNDVLQREYAAMCTHAKLGARVKELNLGLVETLPDQVLRLKEPAAAAKQNESKVFNASPAVIDRRYRGADAQREQAKIYASRTNKSGSE